MTAIGDARASGRAVGVTLILLASLGLGAATLFAKLAYEEGTGVVTLLSVRYAGAALILVPILLVSRRGSLREASRPWLGVAVVYLVSAATFWGGLKLGPVTEVAPIAYLYPAFVAVISAIVFGERFGSRRIAALGAAALGAALIFGLPTADGSLGAKLLAAGCAVTAALYYVAAGRRAQLGDPLAGATVLTALGALVFCPLLAVTGFEAPGTMAGWADLIAIVVIGTVLPLLLMLAGIKRVGSTDTSMLTLAEPLVAVVLALAVLSERIGPAQWVGIVAVFASFVLAAARGRGPHGASAVP